MNPGDLLWFAFKTPPFLSLSSGSRYSTGLILEVFLNDYIGEAKTVRILWGDGSITEENYQNIERNYRVVKSSTGG